MKIKLATLKSLKRREGAWVLEVGKDWTEDASALDRRLRRKLVPEAKRQGFGGKAGETAVFQTHGGAPADYIVLAARGDGTDPLAWPKLAHAIASRLSDLRVAHAVVELRLCNEVTTAIEQLAETFALGAYRFDELRSTKRKSHGLEAVTLAVEAITPEMQVALRTAQTIATATAYARDLINHPAATVTPSYLANEAKRIADEQELHVRVFGPDEMREHGMGAILGVSQGSPQPPALIELIYRPKGEKRHTVAIAGKGITFDSGGLSLKTAGGMESMKRDMAGGANVLAIMSAVARLALPVEVRGYVAASENMPDGGAIKPGDVLKAFNGKTIEVLNTDAEGRLVLADALSFAVSAKPDLVIDMATLTGAARIALGTRYAPLMGTDRTLVQALIDAGNQCGDYVWELPLVSDYRSDLDSQVADIKNVGEGAAGTIVGGLFLKEFVGNTPWAHIDFSSTVITSKPLPGSPRGATGFGVRLMLRYLRNLVNH